MPSPSRAAQGRGGDEGGSAPVCLRRGRELAMADGELRRKIVDYQAREKVYLAGLVGQETEMNQLRQMAVDVLGAYGDVSRAAVRASLVDPALNMEVLLLRQKAREKDLQISALREELEANTFDQKSPAGVKLMNKCKALLEENRELGEQLREERVGELWQALQAEQARNTQLRQKCDEAAAFCQELSQENDTLQGTIAKVAGKLRESRAELDALRKERAEAKAKRKKERAQQKQAQEAAGAAPPGAADVDGDPDGLPAQTPPTPPAPPSAAEAAAIKVERSKKDKSGKADKEKKAKKRKVEDPT